MTIEDSPLGRVVGYPEQVEASVLFPIARADQRAELGLTGALPFRGEDVWTAYELSWLDPLGKPQVAIATLRIPADSPAIVESKSLKLYLNGFTLTRWNDADTVAARIASDVSSRCAATVHVDLSAGAAMDDQRIEPLAGEYIDDVPVAIDRYGPPAPELLTRGPGDVIEETLVSRLFRSNCPVTGQPDWADVQVRYRGAAIDWAALLRYLVSFRTHCDFHEQCVERIFADIKSRCRPETLTVHARFTRRGGLDINPWRSDDPNAVPPDDRRTPRQ